MLEFSQSSEKIPDVHRKAQSPFCETGRAAPQLHLPWLHPRPKRRAAPDPCCAPTHSQQDQPDVGGNFTSSSDLLFPMKLHRKTPIPFKTEGAGTPPGSAQPLSHRCLNAYTGPTCLAPEFTAEGWESKKLRDPGVKRCQKHLGLLQAFQRCTELCNHHNSHLFTHTTSTEMASGPSKASYQGGKPIVSKWVVSSILLQPMEAAIKL